MNSPRRLVSVVATVVATFFAVFAPIAAEAASAVGTCVTTATKYRVTDTPVGTTSTGFVNILQSGLTFVQGGAGPGCVIVSFTAVITTANNAWMFVSATLDGNSPIDPNRNFGKVLAQDSRTAVFVFPNVAPGNHTILMKFKSVGGANVSVYSRTTTVSYRR